MHQQAPRSDARYRGRVGRSPLSSGITLRATLTLASGLLPLPPAPAMPVGTPVLSYTGARSTLRALWALTFLLVGYGIFGLTGSRRRRVLLR